MNTAKIIAICLLGTACLAADRLPTVGTNQPPTAADNLDRKIALLSRREQPSKT